MTRRNALLVTLFSLLACGLHSTILLTPFNQYAQTSALKVFLFTLFPVVYFKVSKEGAIRGLFAAKVDRKGLRLSIILAISAFAFIFATFMIVNPMLDQSMIVGALSNVGITGGNYPLAFAYYTLVNVALEELFFRGFVFSLLYRMNYRIYAHVYSSLLFSLYHLSVIRNAAMPGVLFVAIAGLVGVGLLFNELTRRCNSVAGSYLVHVSASLAISIVGAYLLY